MVTIWQGIANRFAYTAAHIGVALDKPVGQLLSRKAGGNQKLIYHIDGNKVKLSLEAPPDLIALVERHLRQASEAILLGAHAPPDEGGTGIAIEPEPG